MLATTTPFATMVEGVDQARHTKVTIALPGGLYNDATLAVTSLQIDSSLTTDLPEGTRLIEGYPSATASFTLSGLVDKTDESKTAAWLFGPYSTTSPLYRKDAFRSLVTIEIGLMPDGAGGTPELLRRFTGYVDSYKVNTDGGVDFTCIDLRSDLRNITSLPPVVTGPPFNAGLTSEFAVDALLRQATGAAVSSWPAQRPNCLFAVGLRTSLWPEVGSINTVFTQPSPIFAPGFYGSAYGGVLPPPLDSDGHPTGYQNPIWNLPNPVGTTRIVTDFRVAGLSVSGISASFTLGKVLIFGYNRYVYGLTITVTSTAVKVAFGDVNNSHTITTGTGNHYVGLDAAFATSDGGTTWTVTYTLRVDSTTVATAATLTNTSVDPTFWSYASVGASSGAGATIEGVEVAQITGAATWRDSFVPRAVLDPSANVLQVMPAAEGDPFQIIQQLAQAELAVAGFDETGVFRFRSRANLRAGTSVRSITSSASLVSLNMEQSAASVVNRTQIGYTPWIFATTASIVYSLESPTRVPKRSTVPITVTLDGAAQRLDPTVGNLANGGTGIASVYRASIDKAGSAEHPGGLSFVVTQPQANQITITITNASGVDAWLVSPSNYTDVNVGTPMLRVAGYAVNPDNELTIDYQYPPVIDGGAAASRFGEIPYTVSGNPWLQDADSAASLGQDIVGVSSQPIPNLTDVSIVPDPRLQLGDRVRITDPDRTGIDEYAQIFGISIGMSASDDGTADYSMSIDARTVTRPGGWILGVTGRTELASTTWI